MLPFAGITTAARERSLDFLVIGGHAVNALGYSRLTFDLDLLVSADDREAWLAAFHSLGYGVFHDGGSFLQLAAPAGSGAWAIDLMLVARATFGEMLAASAEVEMQGVAVRIPSVDHLLALKLHALRSGSAERIGKDYQDVVGVLRTQSLDPRSARVRNLFTKYGTESWYARILESFPKT